MIEEIKNQLEESIRVKSSFSSDLISEIEKAALKIISCIENGGKILIAGNGGSAADSQHFAAELVSKFQRERRGLPAISLTTNTSILTSIGNDYEYSRIFARQIEALGHKEDIFFAISTSGNSMNILEGIKEARNKSIFVIGLSGESGGGMKDICDLILKVPSNDTPRIQESHILIIHVICYLVEKHFSY